MLTDGLAKFAVWMTVALALLVIAIGTVVLGRASDLGPFWVIIAVSIFASFLALCHKDRETGRWHPLFGRGLALLLVPAALVALALILPGPQVTLVNNSNATKHVTGCIPRETFNGWESKTIRVKRPCTVVLPTAPGFHVYFGCLEVPEGVSELPLGPANKEIAEADCSSSDSYSGLGKLSWLW